MNHNGAVAMTDYQHPACFLTRDDWLAIERDLLKTRDALRREYVARAFRKRTRAR